MTITASWPDFTQVKRTVNVNIVQMRVTTLPNAMKLTDGRKRFNLRFWNHHGNQIEKVRLTEVTEYDETLWVIAKGDSKDEQFIYGFGPRRIQNNSKIKLKVTRKFTPTDEAEAKPDTAASVEY